MNDTTDFELLQQKIHDALHEGGFAVLMKHRTCCWDTKDIFAIVYRATFPWVGDATENRVPLGDMVMQSASHEEIAAFMHKAEKDYPNYCFPRRNESSKDNNERTP